MSAKVISVIMGGGRGTRLYPLTQMRCKPAVPLAGKFRLVDIPISNCLNAGLNKIFVLSQFNTASLHQHIQESYKFDPFGGGSVEILSAEQTETNLEWYQGTCDAVRRNLHHFRAEDGDLFVILSGDQLYRMDLAALVEQHRRTGAEVTIAAKAMPASEVSSFGVMRVDDDLNISEFVEKPDDPAVIAGLTIGDKLRSRLSDPGGEDYCLVSMGIYVFGKETLYGALENTDTVDFGKEVIPSFLGQGRLCAYLFDGYWEDIGTVRSFFEANLRLSDPLPPFNFFDPEAPIYTRARYLPAAKINHCEVNGAIVAGGCVLEDVSLKRCVIGIRSRIGAGSRLEEVVMMGSETFETGKEPHNQGSGIRLGIGDGCRIESAIIDKGARIGNGVQLSPRGKPKPRDDGFVEGFTEGPISIRDGVVIVGKNAVIPDGTVI